MAKKPRRKAGKTRAKKTGTPKSMTTSKLISREKFLDLVGLKKSNDKASGERGKVLSGKVNDAVEHHGLNRVAWGIFNRLDKLEDHDRMAVIFHVNGYCRHAGHWDQGDMFRDDKAPAASDEKPNGRARGGDKPEHSAKDKNAATLKAAAGLNGGDKVVPLKPAPIGGAEAAFERSTRDGPKDGAEPPTDSKH